MGSGFMFLVYQSASIFAFIGGNESCLSIYGLQARNVPTNLMPRRWHPQVIGHELVQEKFEEDSYLRG